MKAVHFKETFVIFNSLGGQVVDTSSLIIDESDIFKSRKVGCMLKNDQLHNMILNSPNKNILSRIYERTRFRPDMLKEKTLLKSDRCLLTRDARMFQLLHSNVFFLSERKAAELFLAVYFLGEAFFKLLWLNERRIYEYNKVY